MEKILFWFVLVTMIFSRTSAYELNITFWKNEPYIYTKENELVGTVKKLLEQFPQSNCAPEGLVINYNNERKTFPDLLKSLEVNDSTTKVSGSTLFAVLPVVSTYDIKHNLYYSYELLTIMQSPGYTLVTNSIALTKAYRLIWFGFSECVTLLIFLFFGNIVFGVIVWFLERRRNCKDPQFAYHFIPGFWDGFWWAVVTMTTVGYGDKSPKTFCGKVAGVIWLLFSCVLVASFGAIMTSSVTSETISIAGMKIAYLEKTTAFQIIEENAGIPIATKTPEEALEMARKMDVYGAMLDTNYISSRQNDLYEKDILVDQTFHKESHDIRMWLRRTASNAPNKCFDGFKQFLKNATSSLKHFRPRLKSNKPGTIAKRIFPNGSAGLGLLWTYLIFGIIFLSWIVIGMIDFIRERRSRRSKQVAAPNLTTFQTDRALISHIFERTEHLSQQLAEIKSLIQTLKDIPPDSEKSEENMKANGGKISPLYMNEIEKEL